ncbi:hypothetical protein Back11_00370 [Paenibacillus baekrokdamisoli]|uniref:Uncharacterized protein n=1 Tax=Paenibacillus baekrokdamisoli TaxID=1712516 RepID=A0A3G9IKJ9_9BACL|nr:hypothetical protein [Paenibacillus baekrokdamisoli]MBB3069338.1 hypothetical protein [Paenibacillus baekrokdamisoli]BBH18692.1 hypothetical protein Back11_00370 [Paenibacillus baekrokdamisoli]
MAFGITRKELERWKEKVTSGEIAFLTHYWFDPRFPTSNSVTKVGCSDLGKLSDWCVGRGLNPSYIHRRQPFPHYDLIGPKQSEILKLEQEWEQLRKFGMAD